LEKLLEKVDSFVENSVGAKDFLLNPATVLKKTESEARLEEDLAHFADSKAAVDELMTKTKTINNRHRAGLHNIKTKASPGVA